ncbi:TetR/AcrR family transcriptional regulator [uncultured Jannaschia sp.]|uniref:TetR/AcrR family transcriptional regulator n=1 Tax=uncultured Jannaschia sp. TaxID=293347 RepID=UPI00262174C7|nr:TetR/AcrR family transcriptional regulator [uncultured Jannaschia sp.]
MTTQPPDTRTRLIDAAITLFQERGYHGTSVADLLTRAGAPKGSLYHHFPEGKADLARAATDATSDLLLDIVARAYDPAEDFDAGTQRLAEKFARLFERHPHWRTCPVQTLLLDGPSAEGRAAGLAHLERWIDATARHAARLGHPAPAEAARRLWSMLIGVWTLARAEDDPAPLRALPALLGTAPATGG